jgi:site-specific recombinase XerD
LVFNRVPRIDGIGGKSLGKAMGGPDMRSANFAAFLERFFTERLMRQRQVSPHTIASYRDTFRLLLQFAKHKRRKAPSQLTLEEIDAPLIAAFLDDLETSRSVSARSRNHRLTAIRSFFRYTSYEEPAHSLQIQRILAIPGKRYSKTLVPFLDRSEVDALLAAPDQRAWYGRRDRALMLLAVQTGLRLSELTGLRCRDVHLGTGAHVRCVGKGRRERCTPLTKQTVTVLKGWMQESTRGMDEWLFSNAHGGRLSADAVQDLLAKYRCVAGQVCPSLQKKRVTPHVLRHTLAMELLQAGVDRSVIALWLGHQSVETTQIYLDANLALKEQVLAKSGPYRTEYRRFKAEDSLLAFLKGL